MEIRPATANDHSQLGRLYLMFHDGLAAARPDRLNALGPWDQYDSTRLLRSLEEIRDNRLACILVAEHDGRLVGFIEIYLREDKADPATVPYVYGYIQSLMVNPGQRSQGIGKRLVRAAEAWAAERGASEVRLDSWEFPGDPVGFYEQLGYRTLKLKLVRSLEQLGSNDESEA